MMSRGRPKPSSSNEGLALWVRSILSRKGWTGTELARRSGLAPSTLLRALNNADHPFVFSAATLKKIANAAGEPVPADVAQAFGQKATDDRHRVITVRNVSSLPESLRSPTTKGKPESVIVAAKWQDDETVFAFRNPDDKLGNWFPPRMLMFATKARDPMGGDLVMVTEKGGRTRVRLLLGISEEGLSLSRTMPEKEDEKIAFDDIADIAVIVEALRD